MKKMHLLLQTKAVLLSGLICHSLLYAAPAPIDTSLHEQKPDAEHDFGIGFTSSIAQRPFVGVDDQSTSLIYISFRYEDFYIEGINLGYSFINNDKFRFDLLATPRFYEVEPAFADNGELDGIDKTNPTYFGGISAQYRTDFATLTAQALTDLKESDGSELIFSVSKGFKPGESFTISPAIGVTYQDAKLVDHFYGVQAHEARANRPAYAGQSSVNYHLTLTASWSMTKSIDLLGQFKHEQLGSGITDSPIVDETSINSVTLGLVYYFR